MTQLSVVIPALNEENGIADIIERILAIKPDLQANGITDLELIVVDDGSKDRTPDIVRSYPDVRLIQHPVNRGYGAAIKTGFRHANGELLAFMDADGTYPPEHYANLCQPILADEADLVIGSRMSGADSEMPLVRRIGNTIFATLVSIISNRRVTDSASGQRVLRKDILTTLYPLPDGLNFTPVMSTRALHEYVRVVERPIPYSERVGRSKLSVVHDGLRFLNSILITALTYNPVRILGLIGVGLVLMGLFVGLGATLLPGFGTPFAMWFAALVLASAGVNIFSIGTTFNYLVSLFHKRRIRQGLFGERTLFKKPLEFRFGWLGLLSIAAGVVTYVLAASLGWTNPTSQAPWFAPAVSTILVLTGIQLMSSWLLTVVLAELSAQETQADLDMGGLDIAPEVNTEAVTVKPAASLSN